MLDKGFDPTNMMQWFLDNSVDSTKLFKDEMKREFEKTDFSGGDILPPPMLRIEAGLLVR